MIQTFLRRQVSLPVSSFQPVGVGNSFSQQLHPGPAVRHNTHSPVTIRKEQEMRKQAVIFALGTIIVGCGGTQQAPPFKPVADTKLLMESVIDPAADLVWDSVKTIITVGGVEEIRPQTAEQWTAVRNAAMVVTESGNLLMMAPRAKDGDQWMKAAQMMVETGQEAIRAIEKKDADELFVVGGHIYDSCTNCHSKYIDAIVNAQN
jgi:hypothetical protein